MIMERCLGTSLTVRLPGPWAQFSELHIENAHLEDALLPVH